VLLVYVVGLFFFLENIEILCSQRVTNVGDLSFILYMRICQRIKQHEKYFQVLYCLTSPCVSVRANIMRLWDIGNGKHTQIEYFFENLGYL